MEFHDRIVKQALSMGARNVRVLHRGRRPQLTGVVDGVPFLLGLPLHPKDIPENYFNALRDLRRVVHRIRQTANAAA